MFFSQYLYNLENFKSGFKSKIYISSKEKSIDCSNLLLIPGFINSHTHIADSIGKDLSINADVDSKIHPMFGLKQKLLKETPKSSLSKYIKKSAKSMIKKGITTFIDFREGGLDGILLLKSAFSTISQNLTRWQQRHCPRSNRLKVCFCPVRLVHRSPNQVDHSSQFLFCRTES